MIITISTSLHLVCFGDSILHPLKLYMPKNDKNSFNHTQYLHILLIYFTYVIDGISTGIYVIGWSTVIFGINTARAMQSGSVKFHTS